MKHLFEEILTAHGGAQPRSRSPSSTPSSMTSRKSVSALCSTGATCGSKLLDGKRTEIPATVGVEVNGTTLAVRVDETGTRVAVDVDGQPETVLRAEPWVVLGLASGMLMVEQAISVGDLRGDKQDLAAVFGPG